MTFERLIKATVVMSLAILPVGCANRHRESKQQAMHRWRNMRAAILTQLARQQFETGEVDAAERTLRHVMEITVQDPQAMLLMARVMIERGQLEAAQKQLELTGELSPRNAEVDYLMGVVAERWADYAQAYKHYSDAWSKSPGHMPYVIAMAETLTAQGKGRQAIALLEKQMAKYTRSAALRAAAGEIAMRLGDYGHAVDYFQDAQSLMPDDEKTLEQLGWSLLFNGQPREACSVFQRLLDSPTATNKTAYRTALGECMLAMNQPSLACQYFEQVTEQMPDEWQAWVNLGRAALAMGDLPRSISAAQQALTIYPRCVDALLVLGYSYQRRGAYGQAVETLHRVMQLSKPDAMLHCLLGQALAAAGRSEEAIKHYREALKLRPRYALALRLMKKIAQNTKRTTATQEAKRSY